MMFTRTAALMCAASGLLWPAMAQADADRVLALEARITALEALLAAKTAPAASVMSATRPAAAAPIAPATAKPSPAAPGASIRIAGFIKADALVTGYAGGAQPTLALGRDFYLPQSIPVGTPALARSGDFESHAKQTRLSLWIDVPVGSESIAGYVETDFQTAAGMQGTPRTTNGYNLALRRAYFTWRDWRIGQDWTNFHNPAAQPETTDLIGPTEGFVFVRQMQLRYGSALSPSMRLDVSLENAETGITSNQAPAMGDSMNDRLPDATARVSIKNAVGELTLAGLARKLQTSVGAATATDFGWGVSLAGRLGVGIGPKDDLRFQLTHGHGIGRYVGLNFAPDLLIALPAQGSAAPFQSATPSVTAGMLAVRHFWTERLRSTAMASFQLVGNSEGLLPSITNRSAWSAAANLFYTPVPPLDLGLEYRHGVRKLQSGADGRFDRVHMMARFSF